jgi:hypothetical protein
MWIPLRERGGSDIDLGDTLVLVSYIGGDHHVSGNDEVYGNAAVDEDLEFHNLHRPKVVVKGGIVKFGDIHDYNDP